MRKKKNRDTRLAACASLLCSLPDAPRTDSLSDFGFSGDMRLEIGCGKGRFACRMAEQNPKSCFFALERVSDVMVLALERALREADTRPTDNLRFILDGAAALPAHFAPASLSTVYLNFSDPWPKKGYAKRRLTHRDFLRLYFKLLREGGELRFKTDNVGLFDFTLEELAALGLTPAFVTRDLHASEAAANNVMTEYEENFSSQGVPICALTVVKCGELSEESDEKRERDTADTI